MRKRHPLRSLFEKLGIVRTADQEKQKFAEADKVAAEGLGLAKEIRESRLRRERLALEVQSHRSRR